MGELLIRSSPTPLQEFSHENNLNKFVTARTDGQREENLALAVASD